MNMNNIQYRKINKEYFIKEDNNINYFFLIKNVKMVSLIKANIIEDNEQKERNYNKINFEENILQEKDIENNLNSIKGIIFISPRQNLNEIIEYIYQIDKKIKKEKIIPKIIFGNKENIKNSLTSEKIRKHFDKLKNIKFLETPNDPNEIINLALEELIIKKNKYDKYENFIKENKINEKDIISKLNEKELNIFKCKKCNKVFNIKFNNFSHLFYLSCPICKLEKKFNIDEFEKFIDYVTCNECNKEMNVNSSYYCLECKNYICKICKKRDNHANYKTKSINYMCKIHNRICNIFCNVCKKNICIHCEIESHMEHGTIIFESKANEIINNQKEIVKVERENIQKIKEYIEDCLKELKKKFENLIKIKEKTLNIMEKMIKKFENFKYDITLLDNIQNLNFQLNKNINYNYDDSWMKKLQNIFELFNEPIKIEIIKVFKEEDLNGPYDILKQIIPKSSENPDDIENITDICHLYNCNEKNYFAVSYDSGVLKIYKDDFKNRVPVKVIEKEFEKREGINSLYKSGKYSLILVGYSKIKKIIFSEDFKNYKVLYKIEVENQLFKNVIELDCFNILIAINNLNQLLCINYKNRNEITDKTKSIDEKEILYMEKISETKIIIMLYEFNPMNNIDIERNTLIEKDLKDDIVNGISLKSNNEIYIPKKSKDIYWKILDFDFEKNNIETINNFTFGKNLSYLGKLKEFYILLFDNFSHILIIFDINNYSINYEIPFTYIQKPLVSFEMKYQKNLFDILILMENGNIIQFNLDLSSSQLYQNEIIEINSTNRKNNNYFDLNGDNNNENKDNIVKIIELEKTNYMIITEDNSLYNLK